MIFYSLSRTGAKPPTLLVRGHATTDAEMDVVQLLSNPHPPSVFVPAVYHGDVPQELVLHSEIEQNLTEDLRMLNRARGQRNFLPNAYGQLVERVRFRLGVVENALLAHHTRQCLRATKLSFFPDLGLTGAANRGAPYPPRQVPLHDPGTGEILE